MTIDARSATVHGAASSRMSSTASLLARCAGDVLHNDNGIDAEHKRECFRQLAVGLWVHLKSRRRERLNDYMANWQPSERAMFAELLGRLTRAAVDTASASPDDS